MLHIHHFVTIIMVGYTPVHVISLVLDPLTCSLVKVAIQNKLYKVKGQVATLAKRSCKQLL